MKCAFCASNVSEIVHLECAECTDVLCCVDCFTDPAIENSHRVHPYRVRPPFLYPVAADGWTAAQELAFLEACMLHGIGNWEEAAKAVGCSETDAERHFFEIYAEEAMLDGLKGEGVDRRPSHPARHEIGGYMPLRDDFEVVHDNDMEARLKDMVFSDTDTSFDRELKFAVFACYNSVLQKRTARKKFVHKRNMLAFRDILHREKDRSKKEKELLCRLKPFARFIGGTDFDRLLTGLWEEKQVYKELMRLQELKKLQHRYISHTKELAEKGIEKNMRLAIARARSAVPPLQIQDKEGYGLLSPEEQAFCSATRLRPLEYIKYKDTMIEASNSRNGLSKSETRKMFRIDVNKTSKMYDFFLAAGWIYKAPSQIA